MKKTPKPPSMLTWILGRLFDPQVRYDALGEYEEMFSALVLRSGFLSALTWYLSQIVFMLTAHLVNTATGRFSMLRNYLVTIFRNLKRQKIYTILNVFGLALGLACFILIFRYIQFELSFERNHEHAQHIYKVVTRSADGDFMGFDRFAITPAPLAPALMQEFPEVEYATRLYKSSNVLLKYRDKIHLEDDWLYADEHVFDVFTIPLLKGNPDTVFDSRYSVVISEKMAVRYFGEEYPIGKRLRFNSEYDFTVTGVMENMPANTHIRCDFIANSDTLNELWFSMDNWGRRAVHTYLLLRPGANAADLERKYPALLASRLADSKWWNQEKSDRYYHQRLLDIHLKADTIANLGTLGNIKYVYILSVLAAFILLIACINYMNMATARSTRRAKEIGVRKVVGARRSQVIGQFLGESVFLSVWSLVIGYILAGFLLPFFNSLVDAQLSLDLLHNWPFALFLILSGLLVGIVSGSYPAFYISNFKPASVMKGSFSKSGHGLLFRNILVVSQFAISIFLLIGTGIISRQLNFIQNKKLGYSKDHIITARIIDSEISKHREAFKTELLNLPGVQRVTMSGVLPLRFQNRTILSCQGMQDQEKGELSAYFTMVDHDYFRTFDMKIIQGRDFSREIDHDSTAYIINETAARNLGWENPIGKMIEYFGNMGPVVGVVNDFHYADFRVALESVAFQLFPNAGNMLAVKFKDDDVGGVIAGIEKVWESFSSGYPFKYEIMDETYASLYKSDLRLKTVFRFFSMLTILICCFGLYGLASYTVEQSSKEIGIRKVLGATDTGIFRMLAWKFTKWVVVANVIAWPAAYYFMRKWLEEFVYRIDMGWHVFVFAGMIAFLIALTTILFQSIKAALSDPVKALKYE